MNRATKPVFNYKIKAGCKKLVFQRTKSDVMENRYVSGRALRAIKPGLWAVWCFKDSIYQIKFVSLIDNGVFNIWIDLISL